MPDETTGFEPEGAALDLGPLGGAGGNGHGGPGAARSAPNSAAPVPPGAGHVLGDPGTAPGGPGGYGLRPSALRAWKVTRESARDVAAWCLGTWAWDDITGARVAVPIEGGHLIACEDWWVIQYGTRNGAGLYWPVPPGLFTSAYLAADGTPAFTFTRPELAAALAAVYASADNAARFDELAGEILAQTPGGPA